jgi:hypothetical protein
LLAGAPATDQDCEMLLQPALKETEDPPLVNRAERGSAEWHVGASAADSIAQSPRPLEQGPPLPFILPPDGALHWDKARQDWMQLVVSIGLLVVLATCAGAFHWLTRDGKPESPAPAPAAVAALPAPAAVAALPEQRPHRQDEEAIRREAERSPMAQFVRPLLPLLDGCPVVEDPRTLQRRTKVLIWDATTQAPSTANSRLPAELRGQPADADLTLVVIRQKRNKLVANYALPGIGSEKIPGYRVEMEIGLVDVARKKAIGRMTLTGEDPPASIKRKTFALGRGTPFLTEKRPEYGDADGPLALWLEHRPRAGQPDLIGEARRMVADCQAIGPVVPRFAGGVLIWDMGKDLPSGANQHLHAALRGKANDRDVTVILIAGREHTQQKLDETLLREILEKEEKEKKALLFADKVYRERLHLCLVYFPEKKALGTVRVDGALRVEPSQKEWERSGTPGNSDKEIARYIEGRHAESLRLRLLPGPRR